MAANAHPDHDTLAVFRRRFLPQIEALFVQVLVLGGPVATEPKVRFNFQITMVYWREIDA